jgi:hypothetical protein
MNKEGKYQRTIMVDSPTLGMDDYYTTYGPLEKAELFDDRYKAEFCIQKGDKIKKLTFVLEEK